MKKKILFTTLIIAAGLILPLILVYAGATIDEPSDASNRMPTIISGSGNDQVTNAAPSAEEGNIAKLVQYIYTFAMLAAGLAVIGGLIYGGVRYLFAGGSITKMFAARGQVRNALYGLGLILISYLILYTINPALVNLVNPTADPLNLKTGTWSLSQSYGFKLANVSSGRPCLYDEDCAYDLACCPAQTTDKQEVTSCNQNTSGTSLAKDKTDLVSVPSTETTKLKWFNCGWGEAHWFGGSCPNSDAIKKAEECSETIKTNCCDPSTKPSADKEPVCCQQPLMVIAKDETECKTTYGSDPKYNNCKCDTRMATCQPIKPPAKDTIDKYSWIDIFKLDPKKMLKLSGYGDSCFADYKNITGLGIFGYKDYTNSSCRDQRLICSTQMRICVEPGEVGASCKVHTIFRDIDCCGVKQRNTATPNCNKYTSRDISLYCEDSGDGIGQCMLSGKDAEKIEGETKNGPMPTNYTCTALTAQATGGTMGGASLGNTCQQLATNPINQANKDYTTDGAINWCGGVSNDQRCCCKITLPAAESKSCQVFGTQQYSTCAQNPDFKMNGNLATDCSSSQTGVICCCRFKPATTDNGWKSAMAVNKNQFNDADPQLIELLNCTNNIYPTSNGWQITSISISGGGSDFERCKVGYNKGTCVHAKDSCHFCSKSIAVDFQPTAGKGTKTNFNDPIYQSVISAAKTCAPKIFVNDEANSANHVHLDLRNYSTCSCGA